MSSETLDLFSRILDLLHTPTTTNPNGAANTGKQTSVDNWRWLRYVLLLAMKVDWANCYRIESCSGESPACERCFDLDLRPFPAQGSNNLVERNAK